MEYALPREEERVHYENWATFTRLHSNGSQPGTILHLNIWQCLEVFLFVTTRKEVGVGGQKPHMLLNIL